MRYLFFISLFGLNMYAQPPSLMQLCIAYIKKEQRESVQALRAQIYALLPQYASAGVRQYSEFLQKVLAIYYRKPSLFGMTLTQCLLEYDIPPELQRLLYLDPYEKYLSGDPVFLKYMYQLHAIFMKTLKESSTIEPYRAFRDLCNLSIPPIFHPLLQEISRTSLAWHTQTLSPTQKAHTRTALEGNIGIPPSRINQIVLTDSHMVILTDNSTEYLPHKKDAHGKKYSLDRLRIRAHSPTGLLAALATQSPTALTFCNPLKPAEYLAYNDTNPNATTITNVVFSPDEQLVAIANDVQEITIINSKNASPFATLTLKGRPNHPATRLCNMAFSPDNNNLIIGTKDRALHIGSNFPWCFDRKVKAEGLHGYAHAIHFFDNDTFLVCYRHTPSVREYNLSEKAWTKNIFRHPYVRALALSPHGRIFATAGVGPIKIWDRDNDDQEILSLDTCGEFFRISALQFSRDGLQLFAGSKIGALFVYSVDKPADEHIFHAILSHRIMAGESSLILPLLQHNTGLSDQEKKHIADVLEKKK